MAAFSTRLGIVLGCVLLSVGCAPQQAPETEARVAPAELPTRDAVDPGEDGQSRTLLQHFRARDLAADKLAIPAGDRLAAESTAWQLPFQSKRMIAAFLTSLARGAVDEMQYTLAPTATFGRPDPRRPHERPVFEDGNLIEFFDGVSAAASRFEEGAKYVNPTSFLMGVQERMRSGAEPMWAYYESGDDKLMFRFRVYGNLARIDYVGFYPEAPKEAADYTALGPAPPMMPGVRTDENGIIHEFDPAKMGSGRRPPVGRPPRPR